MNFVPIPPDIIMAFLGSQGFDNNYYVNIITTGLYSRIIPKTLNFNRERIRNLSNSNWANCPDITRIEAKMWFYYLAKMQIDMGYRSIHLGQMQGWAVSDDVNLSHATAILNKIRGYAQSQNTFVLLTEENYKAKKFPNTNTFMFDYDSRALWPREVSNPQVGSSTGCNSPINNYLGGTACSAEQYKAVIDSCVITQSGNTSGYSPLNNCFLPYMPFNTYFDFGAGINSTPGIATASPEQSVWGWDDSRWFSTKISQNCRAFWIKDAICRLRTYYNEFGFMTAPGMLAIQMPENGNRYQQGYNPTADGEYLLSDEPSVKNAVAEAWTVNENPGISSGYTCESKVGMCDPFNFKKVRVYHFSVSSPDCSSIYTWHIKNPDNSWQPMVYGKNRDFIVNAAGNYTIYLNMDNLGIADRGRQFSIVRYLEPNCCEGIFTLAKSNAPESNETIDMHDFVISKDLALNFDELPNSTNMEERNVSQHNNRIIDTVKDNVIIFPLPSSSSFTIKASSFLRFNNCSLIVSDVIGRNVFISNKGLNLYNGMTIDCQSWASGIYIVNITASDGTSIIKKIIKN